MAKNKYPQFNICNKKQQPCFLPEWMGSAGRTARFDGEILQDAHANRRARFAPEAKYDLCRVCVRLENHLAPPVIFL
jgi:hypothetical protein